MNKNAIDFDLDVFNLWENSDKNSSLLYLRACYLEDGTIEDNLFYTKPEGKVDGLIITSLAHRMNDDIFLRSIIYNSIMELSRNKKHKSEIKKFINSIK